MPEAAALARLRTAPGTVAYLGTSVTVQRTGFRPRLHALLEAETGHAHRSVLAGVGGADSLAGTYLADALVLPHAPDVCFVEFATIDASTPTAAATLDAALDATVAKLRAAGTLPCLLLMPLAVPDPASERRTRVVAERHGIPAVRLDRELGRVDGVLKDDLHLSADGARHAAERILAALRDDATPNAEPPAPAGRFAATAVAPAAAEWFERPDEVAAEWLNLVQPYVRARAGNRLSRTFDGDLDGFLLVLGPASGWVRVTHGDVAYEHLLWDADSRYPRLGVALLPQPVRAGEALVVEPLTRRPAGSAAPGKPDLRLVAALLRGSSRP